MKNAAKETFEIVELLDRKIKNYANKSIQDLGLTAQQGKLIKYILLNEDKNLIQKDLAKHFNRTTASMGSMLKILEREGYIQRCYSPSNSRQKQIRLFPKGVDVVKEFDKKMADLHEKGSSLLTKEEFDQLNSLMNKLYFSF